MMRIKAGPTVSARMLREGMEFVTWASGWAQVTKVTMSPNEPHYVQVVWRTPSGGVGTSSLRHDTRVEVRRPARAVPGWRLEGGQVVSAATGESVASVRPVRRRFMGLPSVVQWEVEAECWEGGSYPSAEEAAAAAWASLGHFQE